MAGERGSVEIGSVSTGHRVELAKNLGDFYAESGLFGVIKSRDNSVVNVVVPGPKHTRGSVDLKLAVKGKLRVYDWGAPPEFREETRQRQSNVLPRPGGHRLIPDHPDPSLRILIG